MTTVEIPIEILTNGAVYLHHLLKVIGEILDINIEFLNWCHIIVNMLSFDNECY